MRGRFEQHAAVGFARHHLDDAGRPLRVARLAEGVAVVAVAGIARAGRGRMSAVAKEQKGRGENR